MPKKRFEYGAFGAEREEQQAGGLSIAQIPLLPTSQQPLVRWMIRQGECTLPEIADGIGQGPEDVMPMLEDLIEMGYAQERQSEGTSRYRVILARREGSELAEVISQTLAPGSPLAIIPNPSGNHAVVAGGSFELGVTVTNKGIQSALIDIYIDELSQNLRQWCASPNERMALGSQQSSEVVFEFKIPSQTLPGTYNYTIVVDAPQHYPEDTPIRYSQTLQVLAPIQDAIRVNDPTFTVEPVTSSLAPTILQPGQLLQAVVQVHNRSDRVDRFRLTCPDVDSKWLTVRYPEGLDVPGLVTQSDGLDLNPGQQGNILLFFNPPPFTLAGIYVPTIRVHSANNPSLVLLDVLYFEIPPVYLLNVELRTILGKVKRMAGRYEVRLTNAGNTERDIQLHVVEVSENNDVAVYSLKPDRLQILPGETVTAVLEVEPDRWWRRPFYGGGTVVGFEVYVEDLQQLPLPPEPVRGSLLWEARSPWQFLLLVLLVLGAIGAIAFLIWLLLLKPPVPPKILEFSSDSNLYEEASGEFIRLNWQIRNPKQVQGVKIISQSSDKEVSSQPRVFDFSGGIPDELKQSCTLREVLICKNVRTDARKPGEYVFELQMFGKNEPRLVADSLKTSSIKISPLPLPKIVELSSTKPVYEEANALVSPGAKLPNDNSISLNWKILHPAQLKEVRIIGRSPEGAVTSPLIPYTFSEGVPSSLAKFCQLKEELTCTNVPTNARQPGDYIFEMTVIPKKGETEAATSVKTDTIKINPKKIQPKIIYFKINEKDALPKYLFQINKNKPFIPLKLSWKVEGGKDAKVELLPVPGTVPLQGNIPYPLSQQPAQTTLTLKVTGAGEEINRSVSIDIFEPPPPPPPPTVPPVLRPSPPAASPSKPGAAPRPNTRRPGRPRPPAKPSNPKAATSPVIPVVPTPPPNPRAATSPVLPVVPTLPPAPPGSVAPGAPGTPSPTASGAPGTPSPTATATPSPVPTGAQAPFPTAAPSPGDASSQPPTDPGVLSPAEIPPQFD